MGYATVQDMIDRFSEQEIARLSDRTGTGAAVVTAVVLGKLADADAEIDGYLQGRYALPLPSVPPVLLRIATDLARYHLYDDRATEQVTARYKDAVAYLRLVADGKVSLTPAAGEELPAGQGAGMPMYDAPEPVFTRDRLKGFTG